MGNKKKIQWKKNNYNEKIHFDFISLGVSGKWGNNGSSEELSTMFGCVGEGFCTGGKPASGKNPHQ